MRTNIQVKQLFLNDFGERTPRVHSHLEPADRGSRRESALTFRECRWSGLTSAATRFLESTRRIRRAGLALTLCLFGFLLPARGQDPWLTDPNHPMDTNASVGASVRLLVYAATATPPLSYQWQHAGTNLPSATNSFLEISNLTVAHAGTYVAWVTNAFDDFANSRTATLTVDPTFTKIMTGVIVTDAEGSISGNWADYDNDGYVDLLVANSIMSGSTRNTLYHNDGGTNFSRVDASPFTTDFMRAWSAAWADYNNDGNVDLIAANLDGGTLAQRLYRNNGDGSFTAVVDAELQSDTTVAAGPWWMDYDNDGFLDLFMAKGAYFSPVANDCLFRNNGDGTFKKMTTAEVGPMLNDQLQNNICYSADYDNDGRQELTVDYDNAYTNSTWRYQADGTFVATTSVGLPGNAVQRTYGDYDNDGRLDAFAGVSVLNVWTPRLFRNLGADGFTNVTASLNVTTPVQMNVGTWGDYDNDGWLDIFFVGAWWEPTFINGLFHNNRDGTFTQIINGSPVNDGGRPYSPSWIDYDNDGFLDLFIAAGNAMPGKNLLYRNNGNTNHWLKVKLDGRASNRSGIGAKVRLNATIAVTNFWQMREISCENAWAAQNGLLAHFGLGDATNVTVRIEWPSGALQESGNVAADQFLTLQEPAIQPALLDVSAAPGGTGTFTFTWAGAPALNYQWQLNGADLAGATNVTLVLTNVQPGQSTSYTVLASNGTTWARPRAAVLRVFERPLITVQPQSQFVRPGSNATFSVSAYSPAPITYQWRFNGEDLPGQTASTLLVKNVQLAKDGLYTVVVSDASGAAVSQPAPLWTLIDPVIVQAPLSQFVVVGGSVTFSTEITGNPPPFLYQWRKGSVILTNMILAERKAFFTLNNLGPDHDGQFRVAITNAASPNIASVSTTFNLTLLADTDADGLPDVWETAHGLNPADASDALLDGDGDGQSNVAEYRSDTNPTNALSYLAVESMALTNGGSAAVLRFTAMSNKTYTVQQRGSLDSGAWNRLADVLAVSTNRPVTVQDAAVVGAGSAQKFYRLVTPRQP